MQELRSINPALQFWSFQKRRQDGLLAADSFKRVLLQLLAILIARAMFVFKVLEVFGKLGLDPSGKLGGDARVEQLLAQRIEALPTHGWARPARC